jgi:hypothetical protein
MEFSLILPTRERPAMLAETLESLASTAQSPGAIEVILYIDRDDQATRAFAFSGLAVRKIVGPRSRMGHVTRQCYAATTGRLVMLANDDLRFRTPGWDQRVLSAARQFPDGLCLIWGNDLCSGNAAHPILPRAACERLEGICPECYDRVFIDTHIYDVFRRLKARGHDRFCYLPDVVVEHLHPDFQKGPCDAVSVKRHFAADERAYVRWAEERERLAGRLARAIERAALPQARAAA